MSPFALTFQGATNYAGDASDVIWAGSSPFGVPIYALKGGLIVFDFPASTGLRGPEVPGYQPQYGERAPRAVEEAQQVRDQVAYRRLALMNSWTLAYCSALSVIDQHGASAARPADPHHHLKAYKTEQRWIIFENQSIRVEPIPCPMRMSQALFDYAINVMNEAYLKLGESFCERLALLQQAMYLYRVHQFQSAQILAWAIAEQALNMRWLRFQEAASSGTAPTTSMSKERKKLLNGRDYTASIISQTLSLAGQLSDEELAQLDRARKTRNDFAHKLSNIEAADAAHAIGLATRMTSKELGVELSAQLSYSRWL